MLPYDVTSGYTICNDTAKYKEELADIERNIRTPEERATDMGLTIMSGISFCGSVGAGVGFPGVAGGSISIGMCVNYFQIARDQVIRARKDRRAKEVFDDLKAHKVRSLV